MKKRCITIILILCLIVFSSCGQTGKPDVTDTETHTEPVTPVDDNPTGDNPTTEPEVHDDTFFSVWQSYINDGVKIKDVCLTGAHDAGTIKMIEHAKTQDKTVAEQLAVGVRYFDLRTDINNKNKLVMYHGPIKGVEFDGVINALYDFLIKNPTEYLLLDFQHFGSDDAKKRTYDKIISVIPESMRVSNLTEDSDVEFIDGLTVKDCRGKCVIFWGNQDEYLTGNDFLFKRNNDDGTRSNSALHSYYFEDKHKSSSQTLINQLPEYIDKYVTDDDGKGIFVLQGQMTGSLLPPKTMESIHNQNMNNYIVELRRSEDLKYICVIMRDYITKEKCCLITSLNLYKDGNVKADLISQFTEEVNYYLSTKEKV